MSMRDKETERKTVFKKIYKNYISLISRKSHK